MIDRLSLNPHICHTSVLQLQGSSLFDMVQSRNFRQESQYIVDGGRWWSLRRDGRKRFEMRRRKRFRRLQTAIGAEARLRAESQARLHAVRVAHAKAVAYDEDTKVSDGEGHSVDDNEDDS